MRTSYGAAAGAVPRNATGVFQVQSTDAGPGGPPGASQGAAPGTVSGEATGVAPGAAPGEAQEAAPGVAPGVAAVAALRLPAFDWH